MLFTVITIFPEIITQYTDASILGRAQKQGHMRVRVVNLRDFSDDKRGTIDDTPYGGGAGMVMKPEPLFKALQSVGAIPFSKADALTKVKRIVSGSITKKKKTVVLSPRGKQFTQEMAKQWATLDEVTFVCGRYEGIDQRVIDHMVDEEVSIGPYVLAGGELGALVMIEATARNIHGVLGNEDSLKEETHSILGGGVEYPHYTKPEDFKGWKVPSILLSGDHKKIADWRKKKSR